MFLAALLFIPSAFVLTLSLQVLWDSAGDDPLDDPFDAPFYDEYEAHWNELFRLYAYIFVGIGAAGVALAVAMVW